MEITRIWSDRVAGMTAASIEMMRENETPIENRCLERSVESNRLLLKSDWTKPQIEDTRTSHRSQMAFWKYGKNSRMKSLHRPKMAKRNYLNGSGNSQSSTFIVSCVQYRYRVTATAGMIITIMLKRSKLTNGVYRYSKRFSYLWNTSPNSEIFSAKKKTSPNIYSLSKLWCYFGQNVPVLATKWFGIVFAAMRCSADR